MRIDGPWKDWLAEPLGRDHLVHTYTTEITLVEALALFAGAGLARGDSVVLVAARDHATAVRERLSADGHETADLERWGRLRVLDAAEMLSEFLVDGLPDADRFRALSQSLVADSRAASPHGRVRIYGEMVNLLWRRGDEGAAVQLEALWNEASRSYAVPLLCAYRVDEARPLPEVLHRAHTHVVPAAACA